MYILLLGCKLCAIKVFKMLTDVLDDIRLCQKLGDSKDSGILSPFDQLVQFLLFDLVCLAVPIFEKVGSCVSYFFHVMAVQLFHLMLCLVFLSKVFNS